MFRRRASPFTSHLSPAPLRRLLLQIAVPLPLGGEAVHAGAMVEGFLCRAYVARLPAPCLQRNGLQRAAVAEGERPGRAHAVHRIEVRGGVLVGLAAGEE